MHAHLIFMCFLFFLSTPKPTGVTFVSVLTTCNTIFRKWTLKQDLPYVSRPCSVGVKVRFRDYFLFCPEICGRVYFIIF